MKKGLRKPLKIAGIILGALLLVIIAAGLLVLFHKPLVRNVLQSRLAKTTGMTVRIGRLDYRLFPLRIAADSLSVGREDAYEKMDISVARLEAEGSLGRLFRGERPAFERVVADGLEVRYVEKAVSPEPVDYEAIIKQSADLLAQAGRVELKGGRVAASASGQIFDLAGVRLEISPSGDDGRGRTFRFESATMSVAGGDGSYAVEGGLRAAGTVVPGPATAVNLRAALLAPRVSAGGFERTVASLLLEADGIWEMNEGRVSVSRLSAGVPGLLEVTGAASADFKERRSLDVFAAVRLEDLERAAALFKDRLPAEFREALVRGRAGAEVRYVLAGASNDTVPDLRVSVTLEGVGFDHAISGIPVRAALEGGLEIDRLPVGFGVSADVRAALAGFSIKGIEVGRSTLRVQGRATPAAADISQFTVRIDGLTVPIEEGKEVRFDQAALSGRAALDLRKKTLDIPALRAALAPLPPFDLSGRLELAGRGRRDVRLEAKGFDIPALRELLGPFVPAALAEWDAGGAFDLSARATYGGRSGGAWDLSAGLAFKSVAFNDPSFTIAGEGLEPAVRIEGTVAPGGGGAPLTASFRLDRGESLFKSFYVSWDKHPVDVTVGARLDPVAGSLEDLAARVLFPTIGQVDVTGTARAAGPSFDLRGDASLALAPFYSLYTQAGVTEESRMRLEGSLTAGLEIAGRPGGGLAVRGRLRLADTALENPAAKLLMTGVTADVPVHYAAAPPEAGAPAAADGTPADEFPTAAAPSGDDLPEAGSLRIGDLQSPFLALSGLDIGLSAGVNVYAIAPLRVDLYGGRLELGATEVRIDPRAGTVRGFGSLVLRDLDIARLP
ncbi:MAG: hypothetical protein FJY79_11775, partial [Candidatus Aminicenantes bacterium]|nr:hypothetical protein [Candidatus Aminicenantes bacterium]